LSIISSLLFYRTAALPRFLFILPPELASQEAPHDGNTPAGSPHGGPAGVFL